MKKVKFFGLAGIILLASGAGFSSCSSDSADPTGGTGVAGQVVKTQFYLNIPYAGNEEGGNARVSTRMTDQYTQNDKKFLGLSNMEMFSFDGTPGTGSEENSTSTAAIYLGTSGNASSKNDISGTNITSWRSVYRDIAIPVGTKNIILYAKAPRKLYDAVTGQSNDRDNFQAGSLSNPYATATGATALSSLNFNLETICSTANFAEDGKAILTALNTIANTSIEVGDENNKTTIKWSNVTDFTDFGTANEREALASRYTKFIGLTAGSANSVKKLITDLKNVIGGKDVATDNELAKEIVKNCNNALTELQSVTFPRDKKLPDGVAKVQWNTDQFAFVDANNVGIGATNAGNNIDYTKITYPAELAYFVSSPVKTSQEEITGVANLPTYDQWTNGTFWNTGYKDVVENRTRFVALQNPLQYGVACLKSTIKCNGTSLEDNAKDGNFGYDSNNTISVPEGGFNVTGILVGGQPQGVAWNFEPYATNANEFSYTIYDNDMNSGFAANSTESSPNYTLVLDNKDASGSSQSNVFVTVELENNSGVAFYGAEDIIPANSKFYLVGELKLEGNTTTNVDHVFVKDHTTIANFSITNLKKAYNHIPDMRTSKINVGLAVDLSWQEGITFNVDL
ncbi:hypothetical protein ONT17_09055 [Prevotella copri]|uniref:hypothetical protein n=1 Tax=Segatella copri TaxID=165179 RepID=UPI00222EC6DA|nr:hypothetical protein [Segatella copri]MCW4118891.1 hypothetical protein [Segatella copri]